MLKNKSVRDDGVFLDLKSCFETIQVVLGASHCDTLQVLKGLLEMIFHIQLDDSSPEVLRDYYKLFDRRELGGRMVQILKEFYDDYEISMDTLLSFLNEQNTSSVEALESFLVNLLEMQSLVDRRRIAASSPNTLYDSLNFDEIQKNISKEKIAELFGVFANYGKEYLVGFPFLFNFLL